MSHLFYKIRKVRGWRIKEKYAIGRNEISRRQCLHDFWYEKKTYWTTGRWKRQLGRELDWDQAQFPPDFTPDGNQSPLTRSQNFTYNISIQLVYVEYFDVIMAYILYYFNERSRYL